MRSADRALPSWSRARGGSHMPEQMNVEVAHKLSEREQASGERRRWEELIEILEVAVLAMAAIATAWSGYQAAKGDGQQSVLYSDASVYRIQANTAATLGQQRLAAGPSGQQPTAPDDVCAPVQPRVPDGLRGLAGHQAVHQPGRTAGARLHARVPQSPDGAGHRAEREGR